MGAEPVDATGVLLVPYPYKITSKAVFGDLVDRFVDGLRKQST
jgi:hypothetical protein